MKGIYLMLFLLFIYPLMYSQEFYAGFTIFANYAIQYAPNFEKGTINSEASSMFSQYNSENFPQLREMLPNYWRVHGTGGDRSNILRTVISVLQKLEDTQFPRPVSRILLWIFTDGIENTIDGDQKIQALYNLTELRITTEAYRIPVSCYTVEVRPANTYSDKPSRPGYEVLQALSGDDSRLFKLPDFKNSASAVNKMLDQIAESDGEAACYFILDRSPSLNGADAGINHALDVIKTKLLEKKSDANKKFVTLSGEFTMGSNNHEDDEAPTHQRKIAAFNLGITPVTEALYHSIMSSPESAEKYKDSMKPITNISWFDAARFCNKLSESEGRPLAYRILGDGNVNRIAGAKGYRLPTEAEMQYAARAGTAKIMQTVSEENFNLSGEIADVGIFAQNEWGLYDMTGSVRQWTEDWYDVYRPEIDYAPPVTGATKVCYGASFRDSQERYRLTYRFHHPPNFSDEFIGMRLAYTE